MNWLEQETTHGILKVLRRLGITLLVSALVAAPQFTLGFLTAAATWSSFRIPIFCTVLLMMLNAKRVWLASRRMSTRRRGANQHTYHGLPVSEFGSFLLKNNGFKFEDAKKLALPERQYARIAKELDEAGITVKGPNNSRVLRPITLEQLVRQLRDNFPLTWDEIHGEWTDKEDAYGRYLRAEGFKTRRLTEDVAKKERKLERLDRQIGKSLAFTRVMVA